MSDREKTDLEQLDEAMAQVFVDESRHRVMAQFSRLREDDEPRIGVIIPVESFEGDTAALAHHIANTEPGTPHTLGIVGLICQTTWEEALAAWIPKCGEMLAKSFAGAYQVANWWPVVVILPRRPVLSFVPKLIIN